MLYDLAIGGNYNSLSPNRQESGAKVPKRRLNLGQPSGCHNKNEFPGFS